jgi:hypothetical protein
VSDEKHKLDADRVLVSVIRPSAEDAAHLMVAGGGKVQRFPLTEAQLLLLNYQTADVLWKKMKAVTPDEK